MESKDIIKKNIDHLLEMDNIYTKRLMEIFNLEITDENIAGLETLINLLEIHEESLKQTRRILQLKQSNYLRNYLRSTQSIK